MKINQVEQAIGITKKNIRFYEQEGLLKPSRVANGYRDYSPEDLETLRHIKLLRKLDVPIEEIKRLQSGSLTLEDCLHRHLIVLRRRRSNLEAAENFCRSILDRGTDLKNMDVEKLLQEMEQQEEGGIRFMDSHRENNRQQKKNAIVAAMIVILITMPGIIVPIWVYMVVPDAPLWLIVIMMLIPAVLITGILLALRERLNEIKGGELNEASKY